MACFSGLGIGLSLVFGFLLLALVAGLYYLLWWKRRITNREVEDADYSSSYAKDFFHLIGWKKPSALQSSINKDSVKDPEGNGQEPDVELGTRKDLVVKAFGEESVESELMRLHNLAGPPRFLFTIKEETKEDLESEDGKSRRGSRKGSRARSLSDLMLTVDTPVILTPLASPHLKSSPFNGLDSYHHHGFNPLFESTVEAELYKLRSSPPPKFKFLRDAEEKLLRKLTEEAEKKASKICVPVQDSEVKSPDSTLVTEEKLQGSFLGFIVGKNKERDTVHPIPQHHSTSSQVLPLVSSPTTATLRPPDKKPAVH